MEPEDFVKDLSINQMNLCSRIINLINSRVLETAYTSFNEEKKKEMEKVFFSNNKTDRENFVKKNIPDFEKKFEEEAKKFEEEAKKEIEK